MNTNKYVVLGKTSCKRDKKLLSISIYLNICKNDKEKFLEAVDSLINVSWDCHEIALVDNGSDDDTFEVLKAFIKSREDKLVTMGKRVHLIKLSKNLGFARANNIAYYSILHKYGPFEYVALINNDVVLLNNSFRKLIRILELDERIAGVQGLLLGPREKFLDSGPLYWSIGFFSVPRPVQPFTNVPMISLYPQIVSYLDGAFSIYKSKIINEVGFFNVDTFMYGDDYVLGAKIYSKGKLLVYIPVYVGRHYRGLTRKKSHYEILKCLNKNEVNFSKRSLVTPSILVNLGALVSMIDLTFRFAFIKFLLRVVVKDQIFLEKLQSKLIEYKAAIEGIASALLWKPNDPIPKYKGPVVINDLVLTIPLAYDITLKINKNLSISNAIREYFREKFLPFMNDVLKRMK